MLRTGLEVFPTPASARCSSYRWNPCKERGAAGSSGWALSGTIPTQAQSAPSSGAAFFPVAQPATCFQAQGWWITQLQPPPRVLDTAARTPAKITDPQPLPRVLDAACTLAMRGGQPKTPAGVSSALFWVKRPVSPRLHGPPTFSFASDQRDWLFSFLYMFKCPLRLRSIHGPSRGLASSFLFLFF